MNAFNDNLDERLNIILRSDNSIRFVGLILTDGSLVSHVQRHNTTFLLNTGESNKSFRHVVLRNASYKTLDNKLGKTRWSITLREKIKWLTIQLQNSSTVIISTEVFSDHNKILNQTLRVFDVESPINANLI